MGKKRYSPAWLPGPRQNRVSMLTSQTAILACQRHTEKMHRSCHNKRVQRCVTHGVQIRVQSSSSSSSWMGQILNSMFSPNVVIPFVYLAPDYFLFGKPLSGSLDQTAVLRTRKRGIMAFLCTWIAWHTCVHFYFVRVRWNR